MDTQRTCQGRNSLDKGASRECAPACEGQARSWSLRPVFVTYPSHVRDRFAAGSIMLNTFYHHVIANKNMRATSHSDGVFWSLG
jgi:hypothetical protein